jgi:hypothetical protein
MAMTMKWKALVLALAACCPLAHGGDLFGRVGQEPLRQFWVDSGFATYHFDGERGLNGRNTGIGAEYRFRGDLALLGGRFLNSDREHSNYAGLVWQPVALGPLRLGAVAGVFSGYPRMREGGWFPALIPVATIEYRRAGVNVGYVPSYKDRLYGGLSVQLKFRLSD